MCQYSEVAQFVSPALWPSLSGLQNSWNTHPSTTFWARKLRCVWEITILEKPFFTYGNKN